MLTTLLSDAMQSGKIPNDSTDDQVLNAALEAVVGYGFRGVTMDEVARRAGVGRMTVYRRFASREELLRRLIAREAYRFIAIVRQVAGRCDDIGDRIVEAFVTTLRIAREHPLIDRLI